jgi:uncharacterized membrane protein YdjX (TVP38/TMEM64 family)
VVILGDALTGHVSPLLIVVSLGTGAVGLAVLVYEIRQHRHHHRRRLADTQSSTEPATRR